MKKLMILGGSRYAIPVINTAHKLGVYVITCDYLPDNIAHHFSDEYCYASVIDQETVLREAQKRKIDGIVSFACDPGVITAAYVAEKMGLAFQCSYEAACILQDKGRFRRFLKENGFNCPEARRYENRNLALKDIDIFNWPVIVKPADSAGSKGVTKVEKPEELKAAIETALNVAHNGAYIIEEYLIFEGYHSSTDSFTVDGEIKFLTFSDQLFDLEAYNPFAPVSIIWPSTMKKKYQDELVREIQRLMNLLEMRTGIYNIETCVSNGKPFIMEVSPRGGGCKIAELQTYAYGIDLIEAEVKNAIGLSQSEIEQTNCNGYWCETVVHTISGQNGYLKKINVDKKIEKKYIRVMDFSMKEGDYVMPFTGANMSLGDIILKFDSRKQLNNVMSKQKDWLRIELERCERRY